MSAQDEDPCRKRARDAIEAARRGQLARPSLDSGTPFATPTRRSSSVAQHQFHESVFKTAQENSIEVYDDKFNRNTILTRSARMRKFKFYQYKPIQDSPATPKLPTNSNWTYNSDNLSPNGNSSATNGVGSSPLLIPRDDVVQGKVALTSEQSSELARLDDSIKELERKIADLNSCRSGDNDVGNLDEIFKLVNQKNDLLRQQMQLNIIEQEKALEKANEELTKELRSLISIDDSRKTRSQLQRQQYLYDQSLALVNKRNELVLQMDVQEKGIEDDNALKATLKSVISDSATRDRLCNSSKDQNCVIQ